MRQIGGSSRYHPVPGDLGAIIGDVQRDLRSGGVVGGALSSGWRRISNRRRDECASRERRLLLIRASPVSIGFVRRDHEQDQSQADQRKP